MKFLIASLLLLASCDAGFAQNKNKVEPAGVQFWTKFKTAVNKNDNEAVASMTRLPFLFQNNELTKAQFIKKLPAIFDARVKRCFAKAALVKEREGFEVFCGKQIFLFEKTGGSYKFTEIGVDD